MGPCMVVIVYAITIVLLLVLSILSVKLKWSGFFQRLFISALVLGMLAYPVAIHDYSIRCYYGSCSSGT